MRTPYTFSVVRYIHDVVSGEFVNVGVIVFAPEAKFLQAKCTKKFKRLSGLFLNVDGTHFRLQMNYIETRIESIGRQLQHSFQFGDPHVNVAQVLAAFFPIDDSSIQFFHVGGGLTRNPASTLEELFDRYVERYSSDRRRGGRDDDEVWSVYKASLKAKGVLPKLRPRTIVASDFEYQFQHCWANGQLRAMEPVSFDYENPASIYDKATKWLGRLMSLADSPDKIVVVFLLGEPQVNSLRSDYFKAQNILHKVPIAHEFVHESERDAFADNVKQQIDDHEET